MMAVAPPWLIATALMILPSAAVAADTLPASVRAMILKARDSGDPSVLAAVASIARQTNPDSAEEIDALASAPLTLPPPTIATTPLAAPVAPIPVTDLSPARPVLPFQPIADPAIWKGSVELGGSHSTGSTAVSGADGAVDLTRVGPFWTHRLTSRAEYQRTDGQETTERFALAYEPRLQFSPAIYSFGLAQYEHDRFLGYSDRYTIGSGFGLKLVERSNLTVGGDLGPAVRYTDYYLLPRESTLAGRASLNVRWLPTDRITISQEAAVYAYGDQTSAKSTTALETLLFGPLKARLSYNLQYERDPRLYRSDLDTVTRASLLYRF